MKHHRMNISIISIQIITQISLLLCIDSRHNQISFALMAVIWLIDLFMLKQMCHLSKVYQIIISLFVLGSININLLLVGLLTHVHIKVLSNFQANPFSIAWVYMILAFVTVLELGKNLAKPMDVEE